MTFDQEKLESLAILCPETRAKLVLADQDLMARLNHAIRDGKIKNNAGQLLTEAIEVGLVREDGKILFPVIREVPSMVMDRAIRLNQLGNQRI